MEKVGNSIPYMGDVDTFDICCHKPGPLLQIWLALLMYGIITKDCGAKMLSLKTRYLKLSTVCDILAWCNLSASLAHYHTLSKKERETHFVTSFSKCRLYAVPLFTSWQADSQTILIETRSMNNYVKKISFARALYLFIHHLLK